MQTTPGFAAPQRLREFSRRSAAVGVVVWVLLVLLTTTDSHETELIHRVVFFAFLVIVPLGMSLAAGAQTSRLYRLAVLLQPLAAIVAIAAFFIQKGTVSAALAAVWFVFSG